jgi:hypothetical protein
MRGAWLAVFVVAAWALALVLLVAGAYGYPLSP